MSKVYVSSDGGMIAKKVVETLKSKMVDQSPLSQIWKVRQKKLLAKNSEE